LATRSLETAQRQTEQSLATSQNSAVNAYTTAYSVMEQALNFISVGNLDNFNNYRYLNLDRAPSQLRANAEVQHLKAVAAFQKVSATPDRTNLLSALSQLSDATREIQRAIDLTVSVLQAATQLEFDAALTADRTQVLSYQSQLNQAASATISATNALNAALTGNDLQIDQASNAVELGQIEFNNATIAVANAERNAQLQITSAQSQLNAAGYQSNNLHLPSPFSGTILSHFVKVGEQIQIGTQLIELGNLAIFELPVSVDVEFAQTLQVGNEVFINDTIPGVITAIEPTGSVSSGKVGVTVQTTDAQDRLTAGQVASVTLELRRALANQIVIPIRAATIEVSGTTVLVIEDGQAVKRIITLGQVFGNQVMVTGGLATGDKLILPDGVFVSAGDSVEVIE
jgi:HlyD family secretion protein